MARLGEVNLKALVPELLTLPKETEWVELKLNNADPEAIGEYIAALSNGAALADQPYAYLIWGVDDATHSIEGTTFDPDGVKKGNEELQNWLVRLLSPRVAFSFSKFEIEGRNVVVLEIKCAVHRPVQFRGTEYIRVGSYKKQLKDCPEKEKELWRKFDNTPFERHAAVTGATVDEVLEMLDGKSYFELFERPEPSTASGIVEALVADDLIRRQEDGFLSILNIGALLFARKFSDFPSLERRAVRVIKYPSNNRIDGASEQIGSKGYAVGFEGLMEYISSNLPTNEVIEEALRKDVQVYPPIAVREIVANALIHQDFGVSGAGPVVEIFSDRLEVTNPGEPLVEAARLLDLPPRSRNENLASLMRRIGVCEERGSGIDKVVFSIELAQLPAPRFEQAGDNFRATLLAPIEASKMTPEDRNRACYLHSCLKYVFNEHMTNSTVRGRFGLSKKQAATASKYIKDAVDCGLIKPFDPNGARKSMRYLPYWA